MEGSTLTVIDSDLGRIPADTELTVTRDHTNQFTGRRTITVNADPVPEGRISQFQLRKTDTKDVWSEIVVGGDSDTIVVAEE